MTSGNYRRGRAKEWRARDFLEGRGYAVMRAAQSRGPADLLASKLEANPMGASMPAVPRVLAVQVKGGRARFGAADAGRLLEFAEAFGARPLLAGSGGLWYLVVRLSGGGFNLTHVGEDWL